MCWKIIAIITENARNNTRKNISACCYCVVLCLLIHCLKNTRFEREFEMAELVSMGTSRSHTRCKSRDNCRPSLILRTIQCFRIAMSLNAGAVNHTGMFCLSATKIAFACLYVSKSLVQGGSNMTGTNCDFFTHK
jgi:hypothetical protein